MSRFKGRRFGGLSRQSDPADHFLRQVKAVASQVPTSPAEGTVAYWDAELAACQRIGAGPAVMDYLLDRRNEAASQILPPPV